MINWDVRGAKQRLISNKKIFLFFYFWRWRWQTPTIEIFLAWQTEFADLSKDNSIKEVESWKYEKVKYELFKRGSSLLKKNNAKNLNFYIYFLYAWCVSGKSYHVCNSVSSYVVAGNVKKWNNYIIYYKLQAHRNKITKIWWLRKNYLKINL